MKHKIDEYEEQLPEPNRSRLFLRSSPPLRRRLSLMPSGADPAVSAEELKGNKRRRKRSYSRVS